MSTGLSILLICMLSGIQPPQEADSPVTSSWKQGMEVIRSKGAQAGIEYFRERTLKSENIKDLYGLAWSLFQNGQSGDAEHIAYFIVDHSTSSERLIANTNFLLAHILQLNAKYDASRFRFMEALGYYQKEKHYGDLFETYCGLASVSILSKDYSNVDFYFDNALQANKKAQKNQGYFFYLIALKAFSDKDFGEALTYSKFSLDEYQKTKDVFNISNQLLSISFYSILTGDIVNGLKKAKQSKKIIDQHNLVKLSYYNVVNLILLKKCSGEAIENDKQEVELWIKRHNDTLLQGLLDFALAWECHFDFPLSSKDVAAEEVTDEDKKPQRVKKKTRTANNPNPPDPNDPPPSGTGSSGQGGN